MTAASLRPGQRFVASGAVYEVLKAPTTAGVLVRGRETVRTVQSGEREITFRSREDFRISAGTEVEEILQ